jgi:hypothetical protein
MRKPSKKIRVSATIEIDSLGGYAPITEIDFNAVVLIVPAQGRRADSEFDCCGYSEVISCEPDPELVLSDDEQERLFDELQELAYEAYESGDWSEGEER